jgi:hypothetical protein
MGKSTPAANRTSERQVSAVTGHWSCCDDIGDLRWSIQKRVTEPLYMRAVLIAKADAAVLRGFWA